LLDSGSSENTSSIALKERNGVFYESVPKYYKSQELGNCCEKLVAGPEAVREPTGRRTSPVESHYTVTASEEPNRLRISNVVYSHL
jgi:hypothetical protein